ncbi:uncharacterized protein V6R79_026303 [Siganus canaliculatus]
MEGAKSTTQDGAPGNNVNQEVLMSSKPLHRFVQNEPRSLGIVLVIFGMAEFVTMFYLSTGRDITSARIYIPFWQGLLFLICGSLSIYTEIQPSKKMVTVCLAMYVVSLLGIIVSFGFRIHVLVYISHTMDYTWDDGDLRTQTVLLADILLGIEGILFTSSLCAFGLLVFLSSVARLALKSTHSQIIVQYVPPAQDDTTTRTTRPSTS